MRRLSKTWIYHHLPLPRRPGGGPGMIQLADCKAKVKATISKAQFLQTQRDKAREAQRVRAERWDLKQKQTNQNAEFGIMNQQ